MTKITVKGLPTFQQKVSKSTGRPYKVWIFDDTDNHHYSGVYLGATVIHDGDELDLRQTDKGWEIVKDDVAPAQPRFTGQMTEDSTRSSIERQQALIQAVAFVNGNTVSDEDGERLKAVEGAFKDFIRLLNG